MKEKLLIVLGDFIAKFRYVFLGLFLVLFVIGLINLNNVKINDSITDYLPSNTETKKGLKLMDREFGNLKQIDVMIADVSLDEAYTYLDKLSSIKDVSHVVFENNEMHYKDNKALYKVVLIGKDKDTAHKVNDKIKDTVKDKKLYTFSDEFEDPTEGVTLVLILCIFVIFVVLLITAKTYFETVIAFIIFAISIVLNMGSNFIFSEISYITKAIAVVLQLALSIDYVIIFMNQYMKEISDTDNKLLAIKKTISKSIPEIFASSLTTVSGLIALVFMQLKIGGDIGIVLSKGIICSLLTVILIMPCLLDMFNKLIIKFKKKEKANTNGILTHLTNFIYRFKLVLLPIFVVLITIACFIIPSYDYVYNITTINAVRKSDNVKNSEAINKTFGESNTLVIVFENKDKDKDLLKEKEFALELAKFNNINSITSAGSYDVGSGLTLGDKINFNQFAIMFNVDPNTSSALYQYYFMKNNDMTSLLNINEASISIIDLINFLYENKDILPMDDSFKLIISNYYDRLKQKLPFLESENYSRIALNLDMKIEGEETEKLLSDIKDLTNKYYKDSLFVGNSVNARDLKSSFTHDNIIITFITILFIAIILLFTFKSFGMALLLILTIEGSILVNFGLVTLIGHKIFFMSYIVVAAIQMGATIDYAIVIGSRYLQLRKKKNKKEAILGTLHDRLSAVITSGLILLSAGFLVGTIATSAVISSIGLFLGLGTLISLLATILFLPAILYTFDKFIEKTTKKSK